MPASAWPQGGSAQGGSAAGLPYLSPLPLLLRPLARGGGLQGILAHTAMILFGYRRLPRNPKFPLSFYCYSLQFYFVSFLEGRT